MTQGERSLWSAWKKALQRRRASAQASIPNDRYVIPALILAGIDGVVLAGMFLMAFILRFFTPMFDILPSSGDSVPPFQPYLLLSVFIAALGIFVFERIGLYQRRVGLDRKVWVVTLVLATLVNYIFIMALLFNYRGFQFSRLTVAMAIPLSAIGVVAAHYLLKQAQDFLLQRGIIFFKTVIVGPVESCKEMYAKLNEYYGSQYQILGFVATDSDGSPYQAGIGDPADPLPCLGSRQDLNRVLSSYPVDNVMIAMSPDDPHEVLSVMNACIDHGANYRLTTDLYDTLAKRLQVEDFKEIPAVLFGESPLIGLGEIMKRSFDILFSLTAIVVMSPLMFMVALLIRIDSRGPVFYVQERIGNDGRRFYIYKFRSMVDNAETESGPVWATANDPRTTAIGRFLRKYNLDELPQFYNVLRGDMSLVGPRPERPYFVNKFKGEIPQYMRRHMVKTGITGWAQVNGWRGDTSVIERTRHDLYYVNNWSLFLDIKIILKTLVSFKNAY